MRDHPDIGKRVELVSCSDPYTKLIPGTLGTITFVDDMGTVSVKWDDGSTLGMIEAAGDRYREVEEGKMTDEEMESLLEQALIGINHEEDTAADDSKFVKILAFEQAGVMTYNKGVVVETPAGDEFQITIVRSA